MKQIFSEIAERAGCRAPHARRICAQLKNAVFITAAVLLLSASCAVAQTRPEPPLARKQAACAEPPVRRLVWLSLFDLVSLVTGPPFSFFPALGGADKTRFMNDHLINRDELTHLIAFLEFQVNGPDKLLPPERAALHTQLLGAAQSLRENFGRLATHTDVGGSRAIGPEAVRRHPCLSSRRGSTPSLLAARSLQARGSGIHST